MPDNSFPSPLFVAGALDAAACRRRFATAFQPRPLVYWSDLGVSAGLGWGGFLTSVSVPFGSVAYWGATLVAVCALLRAALFIHELAHLKRGAMAGFETAWLVCIGFPLMVPSIMYDPHGDHHRQASFGTLHDPEYLPLARWRTSRLIWFIAQMLFVPPLLALRWGIVGPVAACIPPLRRFVISSASTLVINPEYRRAWPQNTRRFIAQETGASLFFWAAMLSWYMDWISAAWFLQWYFVGVGILTINQVRTLAAHRYENTGQQLTAVGQLLDSVNLSGQSVLTALAAPVGLRYHALHHFLPTVPYHSLGRLHRQLLAELPPASPYRQTLQNGIVSAIGNLLARAAHYRQQLGQELLNEDAGSTEA